MSQTYSSNDFNDILDSLVLFMRNQEEFKDMNFDGSGIRELLRVLAFNAQQQSFQNNFVYNELQLDSAQLRQNVTSIASRLGYVPSSRSAAKIKVNIVVKPTIPAQAAPSLALTRDVQFYANKDGRTYIFSPDTNYTANLVGGVYTFTNVRLLQGMWTINGFMVQEQYGFESYVIPNSGVDTSTLEVAVRTSENSGDQVIYKQFQNAYDLAPEAKLYFLRENRDGLYEFKFGDNKFANKLSYGNVITVRYLVTDGAEGNNVSSLSPVSSIGGYYNITLEQLDALSYGGADQESIESIRTLAPISFASSGNAVTPGDYVAKAKQLYPEVQDAICWGGEQNNPPRYGYVFLSVIPKNSATLSVLQKDELAYILSQYNVGSVTPVIVDPQYTYVNVNTTVKYNASSLNITLAALKTKVDTFCRTFSVEKMEKFGGALEMSELTDFITAVDPCIRGNYTQVTYEKRFVPMLNIASSYVLDFGHSLKEGSINVTGFELANIGGLTFSIFDDNGVLKMKQVEGSVAQTINDNVGTVDYDTGRVQLNDFKPFALAGGDHIKVQATSPDGEDQSLLSVRNAILKFNTIVVDTLAVK